MKNNLDYMIEDIKQYLKERKNDICSGEGETLIEDIEEIIKSWEEQEC